MCHVIILIVLYYLIYIISIWRITQGRNLNWKSERPMRVNPSYTCRDRETAYLSGSCSFLFLFLFIYQQRKVCKINVIRIFTRRCISFKLSCNFFSVSNQNSGQKEREREREKIKKSSTTRASVLSSGSYNRTQNANTAFF